MTILRSSDNPEAEKMNGNDPYDPSRYNITSPSYVAPAICLDDDDIVARPTERAERLAEVTSLMTDVLSNLVPEMHEGLMETPMRVAKAWMNELLIGYTQDPYAVLKTFNSEGANELVLVKDIEFYSMCEHHMLPFFGKAHVAYLPGGRIVGLSKLARVVDIYARRLQVQERLTAQVADTLMSGLQARGAMVVLEAEHMCMSARGVQKPGTTTLTSAVRGLFRDVPALREETLRLISK